MQFISRRTASELANGIKNVMNLYGRACFICQTALMDDKFEKVQDKLLHDITVNICSKNEHVHKIGRKICHIKERCHCSKLEIPVKMLPNLVIKHLVLHAVMFLNTYPDAQGISQDLSPCEIIL